MSTMSKESGVMSSNHLGVDGWSSDTDLDWSMDRNWSGDIDIVNNLSNMNLWLDLGDLWSDLSMSSDWGKNLFLGHKGSEISGLRGTEGRNGCSDGMVGHRNGWSNGRSSLNNGGIPDSNWCNLLDMLNLLNLLDSDLLVNWSSNDVLLNGHGLKGWSLKVWDGWLDDLLRISGNDGSSFVVDGLGDWNGNMSNSRCMMNDGRGMSNSVVSGHGRLGNGNWSSHTHSQRLS